MRDTTLFATSASLTLRGSDHWRQARDGDVVGLELYERHYSARLYADGRDRRLFVGPGEKLVLIAHDDSALFAWRRFISRDHQSGICCSVFRNEGHTLSSQLVTEADEIADAHWPDELRHYTYVAPSRVRSSNPGFCFQAAGWRRAGWTKGGHGREQLLILERPKPDGVPPRVPATCPSDTGPGPCMNPVPHTAPRGCVHHSTSGVPDRHDRPNRGEH